ncbi:efflux RND transporter periplasmic adaptor subunit [Aliikangiella coralliicola]|uniref:HlyD family efflux transporter periplasmic adaptor subunit n=1 Tax=Aliikangiella coralliicola TaxID=2592383 RepID=A0A545U6C6_9GAMM|nr:HlyD family efflux transporter periplasmic adaptor subunit [Aliikangiella coralliicola]TQV85030.1 HlyD family efflux transporter periplasmic adaptor subunit [Aliikangiella coralliicola]
MIRDTSSQDVILDKPKYNKHWLQLGIVIGLIVTLGIFAYPSLANWSSADVSVDSSRVRLATVKRGDFVKDISLQGNIVAANSPKLYAPAQGTVTLIANPGQSVEKGEKVATVSSPELTNRLQQEQAKLKSLAIELQRKKIEAKQTKIKTRQQIQLEKVVLDAAKREMRRATESIKIEAISQLDYEKAIDDLKRSQLKYDFAVEQAELEKENLAFETQTAEFEVNQYRLQVENTQRLVNELDIIAPVSGIVGSWSVEQKSAVSLNEALLTVVDLSAFQVEIDIPEAYADELGIGMVAKVTYNGKEFDAAMATISPEVTNNVVKGRLAFTAEPPPGIKQNQRVSSRVILDEKQNVLFLPRGSFVQHHGGRRAFVVNEGVATLTDINLGTSSINKIEIISGLQEGQEIIISNTDFVRDAEILILN